jgi:hypothetical protein
MALLALLGGCTSDRLPRFARPVPADAGRGDASAADEDAGDDGGKPTARR